MFKFLNRLARGCGYFIGGSTLLDHFKLEMQFFPTEDVR